MRRFMLVTLLCSTLQQFDSTVGYPSENLSKTKIHVEHLPGLVQLHHDSAVDNYVPGSSKRLTEYLLLTHNRHAPPDGVIDVFFELELVHILGIDELKQTMTALVYVDEVWVDPSLSWDPLDFGNLTKTWLPMHKIWRPDLIVFNMLHHEDLLSSVRAPVTVYHNGTVECSNPAVYTVSCDINIKMFPLDDQKCSLEIASWAYSDEKIRLHSKTEHSLDHYSPNEEWHLLGVDVREQEYVHEGVPVSEIHYEVAVKRKPLFYMVTLTFPSYVMCATSIVGLFAKFSTTGEREERFTLGVSGILTMAVLSLVVSEKVPHSSTSVPLLVAYFLYNMVIVSIASISTGLVMKVHRRGRYGKEPSEWILRCFLLKTRVPERKLGPLDRSFHSTGTNDVSTHHFVKGSIVRNADPSQLSFEITEDFRREKSKNRRTSGTHATTSNGEPVVVMQKLMDLEGMVGQLMEHNGIESRDAYDKQVENRRRRMENNGYVRLSERLDVVFMIAFLVAVTTPVVYLFICMWNAPHDS